MSVDRKLEKTLAAGERNAATLELIKNWCAHVRVTKFGGTGLVEVYTGYPIGHHGLECDFAPASGGAFWDLRDSALDFYDRNCASCDQRAPVGFPNISQLISERDQARKERDAEAAQAEREAVEQAQIRHRRRDDVRKGLSPVAASILDDVAAFDAKRDEHNLKRLKESARLAPEHFTAELVSYTFDLAEQEDWFEEAGLTILNAVSKDPDRLVKLAIRAVKRQSSYDAAADALIEHVGCITSSDVASIIVPAIEVAYPDRARFIFDSCPSPKPALLHALWTQFPSEVRIALEALLASGQLYSVELAGRGFIALQTFDPSAVNNSAKSLIAVYTRAYLLIEDFDAEREHLPHLSRAITKAFNSIPEEVDDLVQKLISGPDTDSRARAFEIYSNLLRIGRVRDELSTPNATAQHIAFRRLLWAPTTETHDKIIKAVDDVFYGRPSELEPIARAEIDGLLGATLILADRLLVIDGEQPNSDAVLLEKLEHNNRRGTIARLMSNYVEWAAIAAGNDEGLISKIIAMADAIPDDRDELRGIVLSAIEHLATSVVGLKGMLPHLYSGLVGASTLVRAHAATALGEIGNQGQANIPPLVFEAFCVLLSDQYVIVHKAAVRALRRFSLPEKLRPRAAQAVLNILLYYRDKRDENRFLVDCIDVLTGWLKIFGENADAVCQLLINCALKVEPSQFRNELRFLAPWLSKCDTFADLVLHMLPHMDRHYHHDYESWRLLQQVSDASVVARQDRFVELGTAMLNEAPWLAYEIVERLSMAGAEEGARRLATACVNQLPNTELKRVLRTAGRFVEIALEFEAAIKADKDDKIDDLSKQWDLNLAERERQRADSHERNSRTNLPFAH